MIIMAMGLLTSCPIFYPEFKETPFPDTPVNMGDVNSEYDDYNSASPIGLGNASPLCFSTNRSSLGKEFSIIYKFIAFYGDRTEGKWYCEEQTSNNTLASGAFEKNRFIQRALIKINSLSSKLGPYLVPQNMSDGTQHYVFFYADDESGDFDIMFLQDVSGHDYSDPEKVTFLNSTADDLYPAISPDSSQIYFCSNREGLFDIYKTAIDNSKGLVAALEDTAKRMVTKDPIFSSPYNDKCPFILGTLLVFTSDRPGGYGGFDLYYSQYSKGEWSDPVNFGNKINTSSDEYRPIIKLLRSPKDIMIFSSNRPGGKGGFDLYYVGIDEMTSFTDWYGY
jgi:hypothetical protein